MPTDKIAKHLVPAYCESIERPQRLLIIANKLSVGICPRSRSVCLLDSKFGGDTKVGVAQNVALNLDWLEIKRILGRSVVLTSIH